MLTTRDITIQYLTEGNKQLFKKLLIELSQHNSALFTADQVDETLSNIHQHQQEHGTGIGCLLNHYSKVVGLAGLRFLSETKIYETYCFILPEYVDEVGYSRVIDGLVNHAFSNLNLDKVSARAKSGVIENELFIANGFTYLGERVFNEEDVEAIYNYYEMENDSQLLSDNSTNELDNDWDLSY